MAGFVAAVVMSAMMKLASAAGRTQMPSMPLVTGAMLSGERDTAFKIGLAIHYLMMGTVGFGLVHAGILTVAGTPAIPTGVMVVGLVHGVFVGAVAMPMMPAMHPRMGAVPAPAGTGSGTHDTSEVLLNALGFFGNRWGPMTPAGLLIGHAVYGLVFALVYEVLV